MSSKKIGFDNKKYLALQSQKIRERVEQFGGKLYLEFGGKLFDDYHAARVLPGFLPDSKITMLEELKDAAEIVVVISAEDIERNKMRGDLGISYDTDVLRLIDAFRERGFLVESVCLTRFNGQASAEAYQKKLEGLGLKVYRHYNIAGYPSNTALIVSDEGYGKNEYIETSRPVVVVTAPGPGSGKMATCLSQLYHEYERGVKAGYAKYETFPIWDLPLKHPVNLAYEAATADLDDVNMIDPFHLEAYEETTTNYNRDVEIFPVLRAIFEKIMGECPYKSPTDMGVNMIRAGIIDEAAVSAAARAEIVRRYLAGLVKKRQGKERSDEEVKKLEILMGQAGVEVSDRAVVLAARKKSLATGGLPAMAVELPDGSVWTGKTSELMNAVSAMLLNGLKALAGIDDDLELISPSVLTPVLKYKTEYMGSARPRLHADEILLAVAICAVNDENARRVMERLADLRGCEAHSTVILPESDMEVLRKLGLNVTCDAEYETGGVYHRG